MAAVVVGPGLYADWANSNAEASAVRSRPSLRSRSRSQYSTPAILEIDGVKYLRAPV